MKIVYDSAANADNYAVRIFVVKSEDDYSQCSLTEWETQMLQAKGAKFKSNYVWVETPERTSVVVRVTNSNDPQYCETLRKLGNDVYSALKQYVPQLVFVQNVSACECNVRAFLEGFMLSQYSFIKYKTELKESAFEQVICRGNCGNVAELNDILKGVCATKNLINEPNCVCTAEYFADQAVELFKNTKAEVQVRDYEWIAEQKMGGILGVNRGSVLPPKFVQISWNPQGSGEQPLVLVGKGIVFDAGGLSLKPSSYMETMKSDMSGAATVLGVMKIIVAQNLPLHVEALIPLTDNRPGEDAMALGDILTMHNGTTVEVLNADAEGRLILADALSYAATLNPKLTIDVATLTGAANMAVGEHAAVYFATAHEKDCNSLENKSLQTWEPLVRFPLWNYYEELISSTMADIKNTGGQYGGAVSAAKFLQHFVSYPWIHVDIAGSAYFKTKWSYKGVGATGFGVRMLYEFVKDFE